MREKILFNDGWRFHKGDIKNNYPERKGPVYMMSKTETEIWGPACRHYDDKSESFNAIAVLDRWDALRLPHDYIIEQEPQEHGNEALGFFDYQNAWYRRRFKLEASDCGKRLFFYFEAVSNCCTIWVNGCLIKRNFCGYTPFVVDFTDVANFGETDNVIAIYVDTSKHEGWWYEGCGIYRNVWLYKTDYVSVDTWGVFVAPKKLDDENWAVPVEITVRNDDAKNHRVTLLTEIRDKSGNLIASSKSTASVPLKYKTVVNQKMNITAPQLWDCESPNLYSITVSVFRGNTVVDIYNDRFGFRTIRFDAERGFFLNGKHVIIKGVCCHEDFGLSGKAVSERIKKYRIKLLKEMGANGYRTSHYAHSEQTMDALDENGFLVMSETRRFGTCEEYIAELETLVKRDRNRPSVIMWSIGNEEPMHKKLSGKRITEGMSAAVRRLDRTRPVTSAISDNPEKCPILDSLDLIGINYNLDQYDSIHKNYPDIPIISSECCATGTTRGWYYDADIKQAYIPAYDHDSTKWFRGREKTWKFITERKWISGCYQWAGIEHRGEAAWPRLCSQSGAIDLFLQKKDAFYQNQSLWSEQPMVHILPHWNLPDRIGETIPVWVYTNCEQVELFYNGESMGIKNIEKYGHGEWELVYNPGEVTAKGYIGAEEVAVERVATTGKPTALKLELMTEGLTTDKNDTAIVNCYCVDDQGVIVPDADPSVYIHCNSLGIVEATGSDICDHTSVRLLRRKMRAGIVAALLRPAGISGKLAVYASADNMTPARLDIELV